MTNNKGVLIASAIALLGGVSYVLYKEGAFDNLDLFKSSDTPPIAGADKSGNSNQDAVTTSNIQGSDKVIDAKGDAHTFGYLNDPEFLKAINKQSSRDSPQRFVVTEQNKGAIYDTYRQQSYAQELMPQILAKEEEQAKAQSQIREAQTKQASINAQASAYYSGQTGNLFSNPFGVSNAVAEQVMAKASDTQVVGSASSNKSKTVNPTDTSNYGTKQAPTTAVITRASGAKEYYKDGKRVK